MEHVIIESDGLDAAVGCITAIALSLFLIFVALLFIVAVL